MYVVFYKCDDHSLCMKCCLRMLIKVYVSNIFGNIEAMITLYSLQQNSVDAEMCLPL